MKQRFSRARRQIQHRQNVRDAPTTKWDAIIMQTLHDFDLNPILERTGGPYQTMKNQHKNDSSYYQKYFSATYLYESFSDVREIRVWFASKILTPCRMH